MIKCKRCGNVNTAGAVSCQSCGSALSGMDASRSSSNVVSQEQSELPAWLESLRVGERVPRSPSNPPQFPPADLIEEGSLPSWMYAQRNEEQDVTGASLPVLLRSSSLPVPGTDSTPFPATSFDAQSLIDEQSLPSWMQEGQESTLSPAENGMAAVNQMWMQEGQESTSLPAENGMAAVNQMWMQEGTAPTLFPSEGGISAGNLVDKDSVPGWMKSLQHQSGVAGLGQPKQVTSTESIKKVEFASPLPSPSLLVSGLAAQDLIDQQSLPTWLTQLGKQDSTISANHDQLMQSAAVNEQSQPIQPGQKGLAARDLIDQQSLPTWLTQLGKQDSTISANHDQLMQSAAVNEQSQPIQPGQKGLAARDLIDQQSLPSWMVAQSGQNALAPTNSEQGKQSSQSGNGFLPASSLLDMDALPSWLAQNGQAQAVPPAYSQSSSSNFLSSQPRPLQQPASQGSPTNFSSGLGGHLATSSVADMNALPEWLRSSGDQQSAPETSSQPYSAPYAGPPRVENVRVPSRPRSEMSSSETSEIAASVFASMLGVASTAPNFPLPTAIPYQQPLGQPGRVEQMTLSGVSGIAGMPMAGMGNRGGANMSGGPGGQSMGGVPGGSGIYSMPGGPGSQSMAGMPGGSGIYSMPGGPGSQSMAGVPGGDPGGQSMAGNVYRNPTGALTGPNAPGMSGEEKNMKKRGLFGALLDWLSR